MNVNFDCILLYNCNVLDFFYVSTFVNIFKRINVLGQGAQGSQSARERER